MAKVPPTNTMLATLKTLLLSYQLIHASTEDHFPTHDWDTKVLDISRENWNRAFVLLSSVHRRTTLKKVANPSRVVSTVSQEPIWLEDADFKSMTGTGPAEGIHKSRDDPFILRLQALEEELRDRAPLQSAPEGPEMTEEEFEAMMEANVQQLSVDRVNLAKAIVKGTAPARLPISQDQVKAFIDEIENRLTIRVGRKEIDDWRAT